MSKCHVDNMNAKMSEYQCEDEINRMSEWVARCQNVSVNVQVNFKVGILYVTDYRAKYFKITRIAFELNNIC